MELFFAQNHAPMTHIPIASSVLAALAAVSVLFYKKNELRWAWAVIAIIAFLACIPTAITGIFAGIGRMYIESGILVSDTPENATIRIHQILGISGAIIALAQAIMGFLSLRGKQINPVLIALIAVALAVVWGVGGHLGGSALWSPETFPAYEHLLPK